MPMFSVRDTRHEEEPGVFSKLQRAVEIASLGEKWQLWGSGVVYFVLKPGLVNVQ